MPAGVKDDRLLQQGVLNVRRFLITAALAAALAAISLLVVSAVAQQPAASPPTAGLTVLLDVTGLIKDSHRLKEMMADMQRAVAKAEESFKKDREDIRRLTEELKDSQLRSGSPEYRAKEELITKKTSDLNVAVQIQRKDFLQMESKIYYTVYVEIQQEVNLFAAANNISMVLKTSSEPVDAEKPEDILREMNKPVIWHAQGLDITPYIKERLARRYGNPQQAAGRPGVPLQK
jgi:Skp family chaperone for outer membrane proteins